MAAGRVRLLAGAALVIQARIRLQVARADLWGLLEIRGTHLLVMVRGLLCHGRLRVSQGALHLRRSFVAEVLR